MGKGRTQYADIGRGKYAAILKERAKLEEQETQNAGSLRLPEQVFLRFSRNIDDAMPERLERARKDCLRDLNQKSKIAHWAVTHLPPLGKLNDKRLKHVYEGLAQGEAADSLYHCVRRSVEDNEKRKKEDAARKQVSAAAAEAQALEKALADASTLEGPLKVGRPLRLKP